MKMIETRYKQTFLTTILVATIAFNQNYHILLPTPKVGTAVNIVSDTSPQWSNWIRDLNHNKIDDVLDERLAQSSGYNDLVALFINYDHRPTENDVNALSQFNFTISYTAKYINTISIRNVNISTIPVLANLPSVIMVELQPHIHPLLDISARSVKARESTEYSPNTAWELGYTGKDIVIAVLDTGVDDEHDFLKGKFVAGFDSSGPSSTYDRETNPDDVDGHGTHVASIIMGTGSPDGTYKGVAPDAKLVDVKILTDEGESFGDQFLRGIEWVTSNKEKYGIKIVNLSFGSDTEDPDGTSTLSQAANRAVENGLVVVAAAGNEGPAEQTLVAPSVADKVICVTAINDRNTVSRDNDVIADYSSRGPRGDSAEKPDVAAPGSMIISAEGAAIGNASDGLVMMSGTSMAAPHVSGVATLILQANPSLIPLEVKQIILDTAEDKGNLGWDSAYGWGEVDAYNALAETEGLPRIVEVIPGSNEVYRVIGTYSLEANITDDTTLPKDMTVLMYLRFPNASMYNITMNYNETLGLWRNTYTPAATHPTGNYTTFIKASDNEGATVQSPEFLFEVLNNPPDILSVDIPMRITQGETFFATVNASDHEGLTNVFLHLQDSEGKWHNYTGTYREEIYVFSINTWSFTSGIWKTQVVIEDTDEVEVATVVFPLIVVAAFPIMYILLIVVASAVSAVIAVTILIRKRRGKTPLDYY